MAYSQFTAWAHHFEKLGHRVRVVLPSCVVRKIREQFPAVGDEEYVGLMDYLQE